MSAALQSTKDSSVRTKGRVAPELLLLTLANLRYLRYIRHGIIDRARNMNVPRTPPHALWEYILAEFIPVPTSILLRLLLSIGSRYTGVLFFIAARLYHLQDSKGPHTDRRDILSSNSTEQRA